MVAHPRRRTRLDKPRRRPGPNRHDYPHRYTSGTDNMTEQPIDLIAARIGELLRLQILLEAPDLTLEDLRAYLTDRLNNLFCRLRRLSPPLAGDDDRGGTGSAAGICGVACAGGGVGGDRGAGGPVRRGAGRDAGGGVAARFVRKGGMSSGETPALLRNIYAPLNICSPCATRNSCPAHSPPHGAPSPT